MECATPSEAPRTSFVTVVAWIYIGLEGLTALILVLQNILINVIFRSDQIREAMAKDKMAMPPAFQWMFNHLQLVLVLCLLVALIKLTAAIGLLRRHNWARLLFIGILAFSIAWSFASIFLQQFVLSSMPILPSPRDAPENFREVMDGMMFGIRVVTAIFAIAFAGLFAWLIKKFVSPEIVAEFRTN
jgi:hypothetical protein